MKTPMIDAHNHLYDSADLECLIDATHKAGIGAITLLTVPAIGMPTKLPLMLMAKKRFPDYVYVYGSWMHPQANSSESGEVGAASWLAEQVREQAAIGLDGWKILESKPDKRLALGRTLDSAYFAEAFEVLEELDLPIVWHVADPEEFWDAELTPAWAKERGWGYGSQYTPKEELYTEALNVLARHPKLRVTLPHFFFMSADLARAESILRTYPNVSFDLAPGIELLYNLSRTRDAAHEFFTKHADRIIFGTDAGLIAGASEEKVAARVNLVADFLTITETWRLPEEADYLLGPPEDGIIHGLGLPQEVLERILRCNQFELMGSSAPKPLDRSAAAMYAKNARDKLHKLDAPPTALIESDWLVKQLD